MSGSDPSVLLRRLLYKQMTKNQFEIVPSPHGFRIAEIRLSLGRYNELCVVKYLSTSHREIRHLYCNADTHGEPKCPQTEKGLLDQ